MILDFTHDFSYMILYIYIPPPTDRSLGSKSRATPKFPITQQYPLEGKIHTVYSSFVSFVSFWNA